MVLIHRYLQFRTSYFQGLEESWVLNNATGFRKIYIAAGYIDLRRGIDGLASIIKFNFQLDPYEKDILFLFCGRRSDRIKGLVWEGDGFLLLYKRLELGGFSWPRTKDFKCICHSGHPQGTQAFTDQEFLVSKGKIFIH